MCTEWSWRTYKSLERQGHARISGSSPNEHATVYVAPFLTTFSARPFASFIATQRDGSVDTSPDEISNANDLSSFLCLRRFWSCLDQPSAETLFMPSGACSPVRPTVASSLAVTRLPCIPSPTPRCFFHAGSAAPPKTGSTTRTCFCFLSAHPSSNQSIPTCLALARS